MANGERKIAEINVAEAENSVSPIKTEFGSGEGEGTMGLIDGLRQRTTYLSTIEVMHLLRVTRNTLCEWVRTGHITAIRRGNAYLFDPTTLADWLDTRTTARRRTTGAA